MRFWRTFASRRLAGAVFRYRQFLRGTYIEPGLSLIGAAQIDMGSGVVIQRRAALYTRGCGRIRIEDGCRIGTDVVVSAASSVTLGREVLLAPRVLITDHDHAFANPEIPVMRQGLGTTADVSIGAGSWLGANVCVLAGVVLGRNCVVAANSVVTRSFPDGSLIGGAPARLLSSRRHELT